MPNSTSWKGLAPFLALLVLLTGCGGGDGGAQRIDGTIVGTTSGGAAFTSTGDLSW